MSIQLKRGTTTQRLTHTLAVGEPFYDITSSSLYVGDGVTAGGGAVGSSDINVDGAVENDLLQHDGTSFASITNLRTPYMISASEVKQPDLIGNMRSKRYSTDYRPETSGFVTFQFDDGFATDFTLALPLLSGLGLKGSTGVVVNKIGTDGYMSISQLQQLDNYGWELLSHNKNHVATSGLPETGIIDEISGSKTALNDLGFNNIQSYIAPFHATNELCRKYVQQNYRTGTGHTTGGGMNDVNVPPINSYRLARVDITNTGTADVTKYQDYIDRAAVSGSWLIFYTHEIEQGHVDMISGLVEYAQATGLQILPPSSVLDRVENVYECGELDEGRCIAISPDGKMRANKIYSREQINIIDDDYPWDETKKVSIKYVNGDMRFDARDSDESFIFGDGALIRPASAGTIKIGNHDHYFDGMSTERIFMRTLYSTVDVATKCIQSITGSLTGASYVKNFVIPQGSKIKAAIFRIGTSLTGCTTWGASYTSGVTQSIVTGAMPFSGTVEHAFFDEKANTAITNAASIDVTFTATGGDFTGGTIYCIIWYESFENE